MTLWLATEANTASKWTNKVISFRKDYGWTGNVRNNDRLFRWRCPAAQEHCSIEQQHCPAAQCTAVSRSVALIALLGVPERNAKYPAMSAQQQHAQHAPCLTRAAASRSVMLLLFLPDDVLGQRAHHFADAVPDEIIGKRIIGGRAFVDQNQFVA